MVVGGRGKSEVRCEGRSKEEEETGGKSRFYTHECRTWVV